jgi:hypothetical protein
VILRGQIKDLNITSTDTYQFRTRYASNRSLEEEEEEEEELEPV